MGGTGYLLDGRLTPGLGTARAQNPNQMFITSFVEEHRTTRSAHIVRFASRFVFTAHRKSVPRKFSVPQNGQIRNLKYIIFLNLVLSSRNTLETPTPNHHMKVCLSYAL